MVTVYTKNNCQPCNMTKRVLNSKNIPFEEISLDGHPEILEEMRAKGFTNAPIVVTPSGEAWNGFKPDRIKALAA